MGFLRARQRPLVIAWLVCQLLALSAFVPCACCAGDVAPAASSDHCKRAAESEHCPMPSADGTPCPMHAGHEAASAERTAAQNVGSDCVVRGICDSADVALASLMSIPGVLAEPIQVVPASPVSALVTRRSAIFSVATTHDTPPPRL